MQKQFRDLKIYIQKYVDKMSLSSIKEKRENSFIDLQLDFETFKDIYQLNQEARKKIHEQTQKISEGVEFDQGAIKTILRYFSVREAKSCLKLNESHKIEGINDPLVEDRVNISRLRVLGFKEKDQLEEDMKEKRSKMKRVSLGPTALPSHTMIEKIEKTKNSTGIFRIGQKKPQTSETSRFYKPVDHSRLKAFSQERERARELYSSCKESQKDNSRLGKQLLGLRES